MVGLLHNGHAVRIILFYAHKARLINKIRALGLYFWIVWIKSPIFSLADGIPACYYYDRGFRKVDNVDADNVCHDYVWLSSRGL